MAPHRERRFSFLTFLLAGGDAEKDDERFLFFVSLLLGDTEDRPPRGGGVRDVVDRRRLLRTLREAASISFSVSEISAAVGSFSLS